MLERIAQTEYANGVTLYARTPAGWPVTEADGTEHTFESIPAFMAWCRTNYSWPMV